MAGQAVRLSIDVPTAFDVPLAPHHKMIGRWVAEQHPGPEKFTRPDARRYIERAFDKAVLDRLGRVGLADLRVVILVGDDTLPPAIAIVCESLGALDLGWIEKQNVLATTLHGSVAPVGWRTAAYSALCSTLNGPLPIFGYSDLFDEISAYYWDGETDDEGAKRALTEWHGADPDDLGDTPIPSEMNARRPDFMLAENAAPLKDLSPKLAQRIRTLRRTHQAFKDAVGGDEGNAWHFSFERICDYLPEFEDRSHLPPMTIVPFDVFGREIDDIAQHGMQQGFMDVAGICPLTEPSSIDAWFASFKLGVDVLIAAQALLDNDPTSPKDVR